MQSASATYIAVLFCVEYWLFAQLQQAHKAVEESAMKCWGYITFLLQLCPPAHRSQVCMWAMPYTGVDNPEGNQVASWSPRLLHCTSRATCVRLGEEYPREGITEVMAGFCWEPAKVGKSSCSGSGLRSGEQSAPVLSPLHRDETEALKKQL